MAKDITADQPRFDNGKTHLLKGSTLNALWAAIRGSKPLNGLRQTKDGWEVAGGGDGMWENKIICLGGAPANQEFYVKPAVPIEE